MLDVINIAIKGVKAPNIKKAKPYISIDFFVTSRIKKLKYVNLVNTIIYIFQIFTLIFFYLLLANNLESYRPGT